MNGFAIVVGYTTIYLGAALVLAIAVGKLLARKRDAELEDWDPAPRSLATPHVPKQWQPSAADLEDPNSRSTPPPSDPAS